MPLFFRTSIVRNLAFVIASVCCALSLVFAFTQKTDDERFITYTVDPQIQHIELYWKDSSNKTFGSIQNLKNWLESRHKKLVFAMNGGMYKEDHTPLGLFIQNGKTLANINTASAEGNFYLKPNGILYLTNKHVANICTTPNFVNEKEINFATQSGPMLIVDGQIHPAFKQGSTNLNVRNGVGILQDNKIVFAMSKKEINLYYFANYFKSLGCKNALYLDGFVSRTYLPEKKWMQTDGDFGVIVGVTINE
jgi:uncharacterized protein YigE (DUF2233 family)